MGRVGGRARRLSGQRAGVSAAGGAAVAGDGGCAAALPAAGWGVRVHDVLTAARAALEETGTSDAGLARVCPCACPQARPGARQRPGPRPGSSSCASRGCPPTRSPRG
jgi:hypothetical protein